LVAVPVFREASEALAFGLAPKGGLALMQVKWKISKIAATKCHIVRIKCTKFDFRSPRSRWELTALPNPMATFKGA